MAKTDYAQKMKDASKKHDKKAFYTAQRQRAEKTGDTKTLDKIKSKQPKAASKKDSMGVTPNPKEKMRPMPSLPRMPESKLGAKAGSGEPSFPAAKGKSAAQVASGKMRFDAASPAERKSLDAKSKAKS